MCREDKCPNVVIPLKHIKEKAEKPKPFLHACYAVFPPKTFCESNCTKFTTLLKPSSRLEKEICPIPIPHHSLRIVLQWRRQKCQLGGLHSFSSHTLPFMTGHSRHPSTSSRYRTTKIQLGSLRKHYDPSPNAEIEFRALQL